MPQSVAVVFSLKTSQPMYYDLVELFNLGRANENSKEQAELIAALIAHNLHRLVKMALSAKMCLEDLELPTQHLKEE